MCICIFVIQLGILLTQREKNNIKIIEPAERTLHRKSRRREMEREEKREKTQK